MGKLFASFSSQISPRRRRVVLLSMLLAWPAVVGVGAALNQWTASHAPGATLPMLWLLVLAFVIERMHLPAR